MDEFEWYKTLEEPVRRLVYLFRNAGLNTYCSCGHEMYIAIRPTNITEDIHKIDRILFNEGIQDYTIKYQSTRAKGCSNIEELILFTEKLNVKINDFNKDC